jgi:hypothetical protein
MSDVPRDASALNLLRAGVAGVPASGHFSASSCCRSSRLRLLASQQG